MRERLAAGEAPGRYQILAADHHAFRATRADLLRRVGRSRPARAAYGRAIELAGNTAEIAYLTRRRDQLGQRRPGQR